MALRRHRGQFSCSSCFSVNLYFYHRLSKAVKKLVTNDEHEKLKEEMAWQVAEMIVKDITRSVLLSILQHFTQFFFLCYSVTMPEKARTISLGDDETPPRTGETLLRKSISENLSLAEHSLTGVELPTAKYF